MTVAVCEKKGLAESLYTFFPRHEVAKCRARFYDGLYFLGDEGWKLIVFYGDNASNAGR